MVHQSDGEVESEFNLAEKKTSMPRTASGKYGAVKHIDARLLKLALSTELDDDVKATATTSTDGTMPSPASAYVSEGESH